MGFPDSAFATLFTRTLKFQNRARDVDTRQKPLLGCHPASLLDPFNLLFAVN
jgi:hypothetical protein